MVIIIILFTCGNLFNVILKDFLSWFTWLSYKWWLISIIHLPIETTNQSRSSSPADSLSETTSRSPTDQARSFGGSTSNCVQPYNTLEWSTKHTSHCSCLIQCCLHASWAEGQQTMRPKAKAALSAARNASTRRRLCWARSIPCQP